MIEIGRVESLHRYPVKSMRGEALPEIKLHWTGLDGDRQYAFSFQGNRTRFPWVTGRNFSELVLWTARYAEPHATRTSPVRVTIDGEEHDFWSPVVSARIAEAVGGPVTPIQIGRGCFDSGPVSVIGRATMSALANVHGSTLEIGRFRPNIVIDSASERDWLDGMLVFGDSDDGPRLRVDRPIERCAMITIDPTNAARDPSVLRTVAQRFSNEIGAYCAPARTGVVRVGDRVRLVRSPR